MQPRTTEVLDYLDSSRAALDQAVAELPESTRRRRAAPDRGSVAEILEHVSLVDADGLALSDVEVPHPRLGPLNVYQRLIFVGAHEGRHTEQVREVAVALAPTQQGARSR